MPTLYDLAVKYQSDKAEHGYCPFYEQYLPKNPKKLLEIGVLKGASIRMWREYFPDCEIHALDLFEENPIPDIEEATFHKGNQCDWLMLEWLRKENFDIIVDDGSHNSRDQLITFFGLFSGKHYFIEDLHCCYEPFYRDGLPYAATALGLFNSIHDSGSNLETVTGKNITLIYAP